MQHSPASNVPPARKSVHPSVNTFEKMDLQQRNGELHFFIIWNNGRHKEKEILADIGEHFEILEGFDIRWNPKKATNNFCRLFNVHQQAGQKYAEECGKGRFLLVTVWDDHPVYDVADTLDGFEWANTNVLKTAERFRAREHHKNAPTVTTSVRPEEVNRSMTLLLGKNTADYLAAVHTPWNGSIQKMDKDVPGADGWNNVEEVFYVLNNTVNYVILRDVEELSQHCDPNVHQEIDILTSEPEQLLRILNPPNDNPSYLRGPMAVRVGDCHILWNIRHVGDNYYCMQWEQDMLQNRVLAPENAYGLNDEHHFYSLVYHALVHREFVPKDYYTKLQRLWKSLSRMGVVQITASEQNTLPGIFDYYFDNLTEYMKRKQYVFCPPQRGQYNRAVTHLTQIADRLEKKFGISQVKPIHVARLGILSRLKNIPNPENCEIYYQAWFNGRKIFIKYGGYPGARKREFECARRLYNMNSNNFFEVLFYSEVGQYRCIASEFLEGQKLENILWNINASPPKRDCPVILGFLEGQAFEDTLKSVETFPSDRESFIIQLKNIAKCLAESGVAHRDACIGNFIVMKDGNIKLFDFEGAVDSGQDGVCAAFRRDSWFFRRICVRCKERLHCCDVFMLPLVLEGIGCRESYQETYRDVEAFLREHPKTFVVKCKYRGIVKKILFRLQKLFRHHCFNRLANVVKRFRR